MRDPHEKWVRPEPHPEGPAGGRRWSDAEFSHRYGLLPWKTEGPNRTIVMAGTRVFHTGGNGDK